MAIYQDAKLTNHGRYYDIELDASGDIATEDSFEAAIVASLFIDRRAESSEIVIPERRRGWIGSHDREYKIGSKLWLYNQIRANDVSITNIASEARNALQHFVDDGIANHVSAEVGIEDGKVNLKIRIEKPNNKVDYRYYTLWDNTGV